MNRCIIRRLRRLYGVNIDVTLNEYKKYADLKEFNGYNKEIGGFVEVMIAMLFGLKQPKNKKGSDFGYLFECKSVKGRYIKSINLTKEQYANLKKIDGDAKKEMTKLRNCGNPPISNNEKMLSLFEDNLWNKLKNVIFVYHVNNTIVDIRYFNGEKYKDILYNDYLLINSNRRDESQILTLKEKTNSIQIKKSMDIFLSESLIPENYSNNITDQYSYIHELFSDSFVEIRDNTEMTNMLNDVDEMCAMIYNQRYRTPEEFEDIVLKYSEMIEKTRNFIKEDNLINE